jgi:hypothetical protein
MNNPSSMYASFIIVSSAYLFLESKTLYPSRGFREYLNSLDSSSEYSTSFKSLQGEPVL